MKSASFIPRLTLAWAALEALQLLEWLALRGGPSGLRLLLWTAFANFLIALVIVWAARTAPWQGWRLGWAAATVPYLAAVSNLAEGLVYHTSSPAEFYRSFLGTTVVYALLVPLWSYFLARPETQHAGAIAAEDRRGLWWRFVVSDMAYLVLYFVAGLIIFPLVRDFYSGKVLPSFGVIVGLQLAVRGPLFCLACLLLLGMFRRSRIGALGAALAFTTITGVAPMLIPSTFLPDWVRWIHLCEIATSNFLFALFVGRLWRARLHAHAPVEALGNAG